VTISNNVIAQKNETTLLIFMAVSQHSVAVIVINPIIEINLTIYLIDGFLKNRRFKYDNNTSPLRYDCKRFLTTTNKITSDC
jgi:hypothetical protein